ncbi:uncharacterized protein LOC127102527 [Lathyrus oleraceus]|uniref:uncharacterized protein LOC127102527 n=1 Tax=Pisum sativum TaxID=3888 RepID=UPI0021CFD457|nr:uncharacterized protein LOC127102527 [Pisum sativum]
MGIRLEETVCEGRLTKEVGSSTNVNKFGSGFIKKKEQEHQQPQQQARPQFNNNNRVQRTPHFDPITMSYVELFPTLLAKNHIQTRSPPDVPKEIPYWYKADQFCAYHQRAPGHSIENCYGLKSDVQRLIKGGILSFKYVNLNVQTNPLPQHMGASANMMHGCPGKFAVFEVRFIRESLVIMHVSLTMLAFVNHEHNYTACRFCFINLCACPLVRQDIQKLLDQRTIKITYDTNHDDDEVNIIVPQFNVPNMEIIYDNQKTFASPLIISFPGLVPYKYDKAIPYKYNATMIENGVEVPLPSIVNIVDVSIVTRSMCVYAFTPPRRTKDVAVGKTQVEIPVEQVGQSSGTNQKVDNDEVFKLIKKNEYNMVEQLLHTPSKIFMLSLLMSSEAHRKALQKVLEQAYVDHDVIVGQFDDIVANITACNNMSFCNGELPEEGGNHNMALHISMNCVSYIFSSVLLDIGSSLNVMPKSTLSRLSF